MSRVTRSSRVADTEEDGDNDKSVLDMEYGDLHRYVLQGMICTGILDSSGVRRLFNGAFAECNIPAPSGRMMTVTIQQTVRKINEKIRNFNMSIKAATCEITGKKYYAFVMSVEDPMVLFQKKSTKVEAEMLQHCLNIMIAKTETFSVTVKDCIKAAQEVEPKKSNMSEQFVENMLNMLYFVKCPPPPGSRSSNEYVTLGPRTMKEFECVLRDTYKDYIEKCCLCIQFLLNGYKCSNEGICTAVVHISCHKNHPSKECPECKRAWEPAARMKLRTNEKTAEEDMETEDQSQEMDEDE